MTGTIKKKASDKRMQTPNNAGRHVYACSGMLNVVTTGSRERMVKPTTNLLPVFFCLYERTRGVVN